MESMDQILNPQDKEQEQVTVQQPEEDVVADEGDDLQDSDKSGDEDSRVAAGKAEEQEYNPEQVKAEKIALSKERERIRQKEAALDAERERIAQAAAVQERQEAPKDVSKRLKELQREYRAALVEAAVDGESTSDRIEAIEDEMESIRLSIYQGQQKAILNEDRMEREFNEARSMFLKDHADLNENPKLAAMVNDAYFRELESGKGPMEATKNAVEEVRSFVSELTGQKPGPQPKQKTEAERKALEKIGKSAFSEVRSVGRKEATRPFTGPTPMDSILGKAV